MRIVTSCLLLALFLSGCVVTSNERDGLPTGVTLLDSDDAYCDGPIELEGDPDLIIDDGETTVLAVDDDDDVEWECLSGSRRGDHDLDCPNGTSYVRVSRDKDTAEFRVECYGS